MFMVFTLFIAPGVFREESRTPGCGRNFEMGGFAPDDVEVLASTTPSSGFRA